MDELDITKLRIGQEAMVTIDALGGQQFEAAVTKISNSGENAGGNSKFTVELTLARSGEMLPGMYSSAFITLETRNAVPCVPVAALEQAGSDTILYTAHDPEKGTLEKPVKITIGCSDGEYVEVLDGMELGQRCYYEYYDTYQDTEAPLRSSFSFSRSMGRR